MSFTMTLFERSLLRSMILGLALAAGFLALLDRVQGPWLQGLAEASSDPDRFIWSLWLCFGVLFGAVQCALQLSLPQVRRDACAKDDHKLTDGAPPQKDDAHLG